MGALQHIIERLAHIMALLGGVVLSLLIALTCLSVLGRLLNDWAHGWIADLSAPLGALMLSTGVGPINGDFEIVEAGMAFCIFAFLPLCQLSSGHAVVDIFTNRLSDRLNASLKKGTEVIFATALLVIVVQLFAGMQAKYRFGESTFILQFPVWWGYAASAFAAAIATLVSFYMALRPPSASALIDRRKDE